MTGLLCRRCTLWPTACFWADNPKLGGRLLGAVPVSRERLLQGSGNKYAEVQRGGRQREAAYRQVASFLGAVSAVSGCRPAIWAMFLLKLSRKHAQNEKARPEGPFTISLGAVRALPGVCRGIPAKK